MIEKWKLTRRTKWKHNRLTNDKERQRGGGRERADWKKMNTDKNQVKAIKKTKNMTKNKREEDREKWLKNAYCWVTNFSKILNYLKPWCMLFSNTPSHMALYLQVEGKDGNNSRQITMDCNSRSPINLSFDTILNYQLS